MSFERDNIRRMKGYASGEQPADGQTIKLNTNENPYPPSPAVRKVIDGFDVSVLRRYPPATALDFRRKAAALHGLETGSVIATRGGDELLRLAITTFVDPGELIGMTAPTYSLYPVLAQIQDCPIFEVPLDENWVLPTDFAEQVNSAGVKLTLLVNPHAPSGTLLPLAQVSRLADSLDSILLLDEAYINFVDHPYDTTGLVRQHPNLIILRTLSKGYSLAGLRFGYGLADSSLIEPMLTKTRDSYNLDTISQLVAAAAIEDQVYADKTWKQVIAERDRLRLALTALGFTCAASQANFLLATPPGPAVNALDIYQRLKEKHILVRYFDADRLSDKLRISVGTTTENDRLITEITGIIQS